MRKKYILIYFLLLSIILSLIIFLIIKSKKENNTYKEIESEVITEIETTEKETENIIPEKSTTEKNEIETIHDNINETEEKIEYIPELVAKGKQIDHNKLLEINSDYKCWINIPDTNISYPVVMTNSNDFYLHKTFDTKEYAYAGTLFIDAFSKRILNQDNLIIYGHNMKDGTMFGTLKQFKEKTYFDSHPYIEVYTKDNEIRVYEIFSIRQVSSDIDTLNFALDNFLPEDYIESAKKESIQFRETITDGQIITLSTCVGDYDYRLLISGIRIQ